VLARAMPSMALRTSGAHPVASRKRRLEMRRLLVNTSAAGPAIICANQAGSDKTRRRPAAAARAVLS
jgi:hypothetical protein